MRNPPARPSVTVQHGPSSVTCAALFAFRQDIFAAERLTSHESVVTGNRPGITVEDVRNDLEPSLEIVGRLRLDADSIRPR